MKYRRKQQLTMILILVVAIASVSVGFAAFSATLNISSNASVTPNSESFNIVFSESGLQSGYAIYPDPESTHATGKITPVNYNGAEGVEASIDSTKKSISNIKVNFTNVGQSTEYNFYAINSGNYDAFLQNVSFENVSGYSKNIVCISETGTSESLVDEACNGITLTINIDETPISTSSTLTNHILYTGSQELITITISYSGTILPDGPFTVYFGDISFEYSTVDNSNLISFSIYTSSGQQTYIAENNMTWEEWIASEYNHDGYYCLEDSEQVYYPSSTSSFVKKYDTSSTYAPKNELIVQNGEYYVGDASTPVPV